MTITMYRLFFMDMPFLLTAAVNQLAYVPGIGDMPEIGWLKMRKIVYIPKNSPPESPSDYRPLSMLETFYKIPY